MKKSELLAYSPVGMGLNKMTGWGTFLFTSSRACNLSCDGCWTSVTAETIKKQLNTGAKWLCDKAYMGHSSILDSMLRKFKNENGQLVACMSDGEPLVPANYQFIYQLATSCGKAGLPFLLFTNGIYLTEEVLAELSAATNERISFCISIETGIKERYGDFMLSYKNKKNTGEQLYLALENKIGFLKSFDQKVLSQTGKHGLSIHTYIIPGKTIEDDIRSLESMVERLGHVPFIVSTMGVHSYESLKGKVHNITEETVGLIKKYKTGPTATLSFGDGESKKLCSYIANDYYPFEQPTGIFGITFNPYNKGQVQSCPYHSVLGTSEWFNLRDFLDELAKAGKEIDDAVVGAWLDTAISIESQITRSAFDLTGYEHCLMRHSRKPEIDLFISNINVEMVKKCKQGLFAHAQDDYLQTVIRHLMETVQELSVELKG